MKKISLYTFLFLLIDQILKILVRMYLNLYNDIILIPNFLSLIHVKNDGAAFSILEGKTIFFIIITIIVLIGIIYYIKNKNFKKIDYIIYGMLIGGIIGNLIDRIIYGNVTDFISFTIFNKPMPIFNLADTFICIGCILMIWREEICKNSK
mgnify:FL=1